MDGRLAMGEAVALADAEIRRQAARGQTHDPALDGDDLVQACYLRAWPLRPDFADAAECCAYFGRAVAMRRIDLARRATLLAGYHLALDPERALPDPRDEMGTALDRAELVDLLRQARGKSARGRAVTGLRVLIWNALGWDYGEIAAATGVGAATLKSRAFQARQHFDFRRVAPVPARSPRGDRGDLVAMVLDW